MDNTTNERNGRAGAVAPPRLVRYGLSPPLGNRNTGDGRADDAEAHFLRGTELATQGRRGEAIPEFREAIRLQPEHSRAHFNLGVALGLDKKHREALACFREAIRSEPAFADAHYGLGNTLIELDRIEEAVTAYQDAIRLKPDSVDALNNLGMALTRVGRGGEAEVFLRQAVRLRPDVPEAHNTLGLAYMEQGEFDLGQACFEKAAARRATRRHTPTWAAPSRKSGGPLRPSPPMTWPWRWSPNR